MLAVDWDGTCVPSLYPKQPREWLPGAKEALTELQKKFEVVIFSCRVRGSLDAPPESEVAYIQSMLAEAKLTRVKVWTVPGKPNAVLFIDDRGLHYEGDWSIVMEQVTQRTGVKFQHAKRVKSSMYLESTSGLSPRQIRDKVNGFVKD